MDDKEEIHDKDNTTEQESLDEIDTLIEYLSLEEQED